MNRSNNRTNRDNSPTELSTDAAVSPNALVSSQKVSNKDQILKVIYAVACFANLVINLDHGILPACTQEIKRDLKIDEFKLGLLGSVVYIGLMLGSITSGPLLQTYSSKKIIAFSTLGNIISLFIFPMTENFFLLCLSRGLVGFFQVFAVIYFPVWVDTYGKEKKTLWITFLQLGVALGVFFGYGLTAIFVQFFTWRISFYTQIVLLIPCFLAFAAFDEKLMSTKDANEKEERGGRASEDGRERYLLSVSHSGSFFGNEIRDYVLANEPGTAGRRSNAQRHSLAEEEEDEVAGKLTYFDYIKILWTKKVYIYTMLAISSLYFVITGIQFWISDYLRNVLGEEKEKVFMSFALISITGPTSGVVLGGTILDRLGGYTGKGALDFCLVCGTFASLSAIPVPFLNHFMSICVLLWLVMFFGGALMPAVIGIMLSSIPKNMRALGYSAAQIVQNFLGYVPAPVVYGFVVEITGGEDSRYGMILLMSWSSLGVFCLFAAKNARIKKHEDYMHRQHLEFDGDGDLNRPDLFEPKPQVSEPINLDLEAVNDDYVDMDAMTTRKIRHQRTRTFGELAPDATTRHKSVIAGKSGKIERELEALNAATVDYRTLRGQRSSILSSENLGNFNMMFGRATVDKQLKDIEDEML